MFSNFNPQLCAFLKSPWTPKLAYHFPKSTQFSENFDTNIGTQHFVNTKNIHSESTIYENDAENETPC